MTEGYETITQRPSLPVRAREAHKGNFGRVLVVGGSLGMVGAPAMTANAALRGGAGLCTVAVPSVVQQTVAGLCPCATSLPLACDEAGGLAPRSVRQVIRAAARADVLAMGPGLDVSAPRQNLIRAALDQEKPLVFDADALNNLAKMPDWPSLRKCPLVLTPHAGEFSRLTGASVVGIEANREELAVSVTCDWASRAAGKLVVLLKGAATVVTDGSHVYVNDTGNPGMATGGSGDVLTGLVAAFIGQGLAPFGAACLAAWVHGRAGDLGAAELGEASLMAWDLLDYLPAAMKEVVA